MISVVLSNYNGQDYLGEAIESVLEQNYLDYEFIIVDDGSTDNSRQIIENFHQKYPERIYPIYQSTNKGQAEGFNVGVKASQGEIICFLDSDDIWFPTKLRTVHDFFANTTDTVAILQHNLVLIQDGEIITSDKFRDQLFTGDYFNFTKKHRGNFLPTFVPTSGLSIPRDIIEKILPIPTMFRTCADGFLTRTTFCYGKVVSIRECLGAYRVHQGNNVFANSSFDSDEYLYELLIPSINSYYDQHGIDLQFINKQSHAPLLDKRTFNLPHNVREVSLIEIFRERYRTIVPLRTRLMLRSARLTMSSLFRR